MNENRAKNVEVDIINNLDNQEFIDSSVDNGGQENILPTQRTDGSVSKRFRKRKKLNSRYA